MYYNYIHLHITYGNESWGNVNKLHIIKKKSYEYILENHLEHMQISQPFLELKFRNTNSSTAPPNQNRNTRVQNNYK